MRPLEFCKLHPVLKQAEHTIVAGKHRGLSTPDIPLRDQCVKRVEGAALANLFIGQPVHKLQQLHRKFNISDAARPKLDLQRHRWTESTKFSRAALVHTMGCMAAT